MTTSWSHLVRGEFASAVSANAGGTLLGLLALAAVPWLLCSAAVGRYVGFSPRPELWGVVAAFVAAVTLIHWVWLFAAP